MGESLEGGNKKACPNQIIVKVSITAIILTGNNSKWENLNPSIARGASAPSEGITELWSDWVAGQTRCARARKGTLNLNSPLESEVLVIKAALSRSFSFCSSVSAGALLTARLASCVCYLVENMSHSLNQETKLLVECQILNSACDYIWLWDFCKSKDLVSHLILVPILLGIIVSPILRIV